jgi:hypothetical protein
VRDKRRQLSKRRAQKELAKAERNRAQGKTAVYDDGRRYNAYQCSPQGGCGGIYLTVDLDKGVTPMFMPCLVTQDCPGMAMSLGYPKSPPPRKLKLLVEWYEPDDAALTLMTTAMFDHVRQGGLLRRPGPDAPGWVAERLGPVFPRTGEMFTQLTLIEGDNDAAQKSSDHVHHAGSESGGSEGAEPGDSGVG